MATLEKEIWVDQLMKNFYPDSSFLKYAKDFSSLVDYNAINMAEVGADPDVLINNTTYPIKVVQRVDKPLRIELDKFETENTLVRRPVVIEYSYDQLESVLMGHRNTLRAKTAMKAAHAFAPQKNTADTPVIQTTGATVNGRKRLTLEDIVALKEHYDNANIPLEGRYLVLHPSHVTDLILLDAKHLGNITDLKDGKPMRFAGFNMLQTSITPQYGDNLEKIAFDSENKGNFCSFSFHGEEVMKADGEVFMYSRENDPEERGTIVGFDKRFIALPIRNKGIGAIVSATAS